MGDYDPHAVTVSPAATIMIVTDMTVRHSEHLHVLLVRRSTNMAFAADSWVFPGGRVDPQDHDATLWKRCIGLDDLTASTKLDIATGGLAWWVAACRETLEETGLLISASDTSDVVVEQIQRALINAEGSFAKELQDHDIYLDLGRIEQVARFVTPLGPPRRFDTHFFMTKVSPSQIRLQDQDEIIAGHWVEPDKAIRAWRAGEANMMSPTIRMLQCLSRYPSSSAAMQAAKQHNQYRRVRVIDPQGEYRVVLPGEPGYENADLEVESGWVRL